MLSLMYLWMRAASNREKLWVITCSVFFEVNVKNILVKHECIYVVILVFLIMYNMKTILLVAKKGIKKIQHNTVTDN